MIVILMVVVCAVLLVFAAPLLPIGLLAFVLIYISLKMLPGQVRGLGTEIERVREYRKKRAKEREVEEMKKRRIEMERRARDRKHNHGVQRPGADGYYNKAIPDVPWRRK